MNEDYELTYVVPVYNAKNNLARLCNSIVKIGIKSSQIVLVDDASKDGSRETAKEIQTKIPNVTIIDLDQNCGAGNARNIGFDNSRGKYTIFFDSDDIIHGDKVQEAIDAMNVDQNIDVAMFSYNYDDMNPGSYKGMSYLDQSIINKILKKRESRIVSIGMCPSLARFSNYPWNKIIRTDKYRSQNLKFSPTAVNNDMLGHWQIVTLAEKILVTRAVICTHVMGSESSNITNEVGKKRLEMFSALQDVYSFLEQYPTMRRLLCSQYWDLALSLAEWYKDRMHPSLEAEYNSKLRQLIMGINIEDLLVMKAGGDNVLSKKITSIIARA
ncbi:glycosyltransferase family 2 protein [Paracoccus marcusii]|uniref:glycosyltransferase family 2 protein n=1 Tax=Paracoccus marcusii TaxID=59779 RepID=UPI002492772B|nr:glycosyltransferase family 2 protein [Paracoccus marcusii]